MKAPAKTVRAAASGVVAAAVVMASTAGAATTTKPTDPARCATQHVVFNPGWPTDANSGGNANQGISTDLEGRDVTCIETSLSLVKSGSTTTLPKVGETGTLTLTIRTDAAEGTGKVGVSIVLPTGIVATTLPSGFKNTTLGDPYDPRSTARVKGDGSHGAALWGNTSISGGRTYTLNFGVRVASSGEGTIESGVGDVNDSITETATRSVTPVANSGGRASLPLTYGAAGTTRKLVVPESLAGRRVDSALVDSKAANWPKGTTGPNTGGQGTCPGDATPGQGGFCPGVDELAPQVNIVPPHQAQGIRGVRAKAAANTCIDGRLIYTDQSGSIQPSVNVPVTAMDENPVDDDEIGSAVTDWGGNFHVCFDNGERGWWPGSSGNADVYLKFRLETNAWRVEDRCCLDTGWTPRTYVIKTGTTNDIGGGTVNWGAISAPANYQRALHAFDELNQAWNFSVSNSPGTSLNCWENSDCDKKTIMWTPDAREWPHYSGSCAWHYVGSVVCLPDNGPDWYPTVLHEIGHNVMNDVYDGSYPPTSCPSPHFGYSNEEAGCAWTEGFASWFADAVLDSPTNTGYGGEISPSDLTPQPWKAPAVTDLPSWQRYNQSNRGSNAEQRIVDALWDIGDATNEAPWDRLSLGHQAVWNAFRHGRPNTFGGLIGALATEGVDTDSSDFASTLYASTIDLASKRFRDPLPNDEWVTRPMPPSAPPSPTAMAPGGSAIPTDTSDGHAFVWDRSGSGWCTETVDMQNVGSWASGYLIDGGDPANFGHRFWAKYFNLLAYSNQAMTVSSLVSSATTGNASLYTTGSISIKLPKLPRKIWIGTASSHYLGPSDSIVSPARQGSFNAPLTNVYKIRANACHLVKLGSVSLISAMSHAFIGVELNAGKAARVVVTPTSKTSDGRTNSVSASVAFGTGCNARSTEPQANVNCEYGKAIASASGAQSPGKPVTISFTPQQSGLYQIETNSLIGPGGVSVTATQG